MSELNQTLGIKSAMIVQQTMKNLSHKVITVCSRPLIGKSLEGVWDQECFLYDQNIYLANCILISTICSQNFNWFRDAIAEL